MERRREERRGKGREGRIERTARKGRGQEVHEEGEVKAEQIKSEKKENYDTP